MKIVAIIGTRPQYIKHGALMKTLKMESDINVVTVDTGQHYDDNMSRVFIETLQLSDIRYNLHIRSQLHGEQTAKMLIDIENILLNETPDYVIVYGDTNSTLAGALAASKLKIPIIHIEAGMRNHNLQVPEEINRTITDRISFLRFAPSLDSLENLNKEGLGKNSFNVGDITTDLIISFRETHSEYRGKPYIFSTIHRPFNTDSKERVTKILNALNGLSTQVILSLHPRTRNAMKEWSIEKSNFANIEFIEPLTFFESLEMIANSTSVITDSGGVQKEAYLLKKKCTTILPYTPWVESLNGDWNKLMFDDFTDLPEIVDRTIDQKLYQETIYGDGNVGRRILQTILECKKSS